MIEEKRIDFSTGGLVNGPVLINANEGNEAIVPIPNNWNTIEWITRKALRRDIK